MHWQIIDNKPKRVPASLRELWQQRELLLSMIRRELRMRFAKTLGGWFWAIFKPLMYLIIYSFFFTYVARIDTGDLPYPLFVMSGMLAWHFFLDTTMKASQALIQEANLIKKNNIPRLMIPIYKAIPSIIDFALSLGLFFLLQLFFKFPITYLMLSLVIILPINWFIAMGLVLWLNILTLRRRDLNFLTTSILPFGIWMSTVFYPAELVPMPYQQLLYLNPMAGIIAWYRWALLAQPLPHPGYWIGIGLGMLLFFSGIWIFIRKERWITERI